MNPTYTNMLEKPHLAISHPRALLSAVTIPSHMFNYINVYIHKWDVRLAGRASSQEQILSRLISNCGLRLLF